MEVTGLIVLVLSVAFAIAYLVYRNFLIRTKGYDCDKNKLLAMAIGVGIIVLLCKNALIPSALLLLAGSVVLAVLRAKPLGITHASAVAVVQICSCVVMLFWMLFKYLWRLVAAIQSGDSKTYSFIARTGRDEEKKKELMREYESSQQSSADMGTYQQGMQQVSTDYLNDSTAHNYDADLARKH
ncbi:MAG: hypothetical protein H6Q60_822 [Oscillospiraceae bacterium]|nr:hypothetical protein [Oscillospiraceae bacterium]